MTSDWPRFLGSSHDLISPETKLLKTWPEKGPTLLWEVEKGVGYTSPAVAGGRLILFHRLGDEEIVECLDAETGSLYWSHAYPTDYVDRYGFNGGPRASPVIHGSYVLTHGAQGKIHCFSLSDGKLLWHHDIAAEYKVPQNFFGVGSTALGEGDLFIVQVGAPGGPCIVAFKAKTGEVAWTAGDKWRASYASPIPADLNGRRRILVFAGGESDPATGGLLTIDPTNGHIESRFPFRSKNPISVNASSPTLVGQQVFLSTSYRTGCTLVDLATPGEVRKVWKTNALESHFSTAIHRDGFLYGFHGSGSHNTAIVCVDTKSGEQKWKFFPELEGEALVQGTRQSVPMSTGRGSLLYADGAFLCLGEQGHLLWLDLTPEGHRILDQTRLFAAAETWSPPALSRGLLYVMQNTKDKLAGTPPRLLCYDLRGP